MSAPDGADPNWCAATLTNIDQAFAQMALIVDIYHGSESEDGA